jgi:hypothetical protein
MAWNRTAALWGGAMALAIALGACGERGVWTKEGATSSERVTTQKNCVAESGQYDFLNNEGLSPTGRYSTNQQSDVYRMCMYSRGYGQLPYSEFQKQQQEQKKAQ